MARQPRSWWTRSALCGLGVASLVGTMLAPCSSALAAPTRDPAGKDAEVLTAAVTPSFIPNDGIDVIVGVPGEDRGSVVDAGAVEVRDHAGRRAPQALVLPKAHAHDAFGSAVATGLLNNDAFLDVAVGVPGLDVHGQADAGGVALFYGSAKGLRYAKTLTQASAHVGGSVQAHARFGQTLSATGYEPDRTTTLRVGEPGRTVAGAKGAGGYVDYALQRGRFQAKTSGQVTLATAGVPGRPQAGDAMGSSFYSSYEVGIPGRTVNGAKGAGAVLTTYVLSPGYSLMTQASPGMPGTPEAGDHFGASLAQSWIGVPGESVGDVAGAGIVERPDSDQGGIALTQHDVDPSQVVEADDHFGAAITETGILVDDFDWAPRLLLVGAPGQDVSGHADAGTVSVIGASSGPEEPFVLGASKGELQPASVVAGAHFGAVLARNDLASVQVGAPDARGGRVTLFSAPSADGVPPTRVATLAQEAGKPEPGDHYGGALVLSPV